MPLPRPLYALQQLQLAAGIYTTAPAIHALLDKLAWPGPGGRLSDPSAGDGAFPIGALERLDLAADDLAAAAAVSGWEIYPPAVGDARHRIAHLDRVASHRAAALPAAAQPRHDGCSRRRGAARRNVRAPDQGKDRG